jgi:hypothetical protein
MVRAYDATEWEVFIREWQKGLQGYAEVKRLGGAGDHGRDVIGLVSSLGCEGVWDNFQCKHYETPLTAPKAVEDAGKIIYHASQGVFLPPRKCKFVAPRGPTTELRDLLLYPTKFRDEVIATWDKRVAKKIEAGEDHALVGSLAAYVSSYDFSTFGYSTLDEILDDHRKTAYWASRFGGALPPAPAGVTPAGISSQELVYVGKLYSVYEEASGKSVADVADLIGHPELQEDLQRQRIRFYDAEAFVAHYRDQTEPGTVEDFAEQIYDAIEPALNAPATAQGRLTAVMTAAGQASPANLLSPQGKIRVKQGVCHQLANGPRVGWKKP